MKGMKKWSEGKKENDDKSDNLEAMENSKEKRMGITKTWSTKMDCT